MEYFSSCLFGDGVKCRAFSSFFLSEFYNSCKHRFTKVLHKDLSKFLILQRLDQNNDLSDAPRPEEDFAFLGSCLEFSEMVIPFFLNKRKTSIYWSVRNVERMQITSRWYSGFQVMGQIEGSFGGLKFSIPGFFREGKFGKYFFGWLQMVWWRNIQFLMFLFLRYIIYCLLEIFEARKLHVGFLGFIFGSGIFVGFCWEP